MDINEIKRVADEFKKVNDEIDKEVLSKKEYIKEVVDIPLNKLFLMRLINDIATCNIVVRLSREDRVHYIEKTLDLRHKSVVFDSMEELDDKLYMKLLHNPETLCYYFEVDSTVDFTLLLRLLNSEILSMALLDKLCIDTISLMKVNYTPKCSERRKPLIPYPDNPLSKSTIFSKTENLPSLVDCLAEENPNILTHSKKHIYMAKDSEGDYYLLNANSLIFVCVYIKEEDTHEYWWFKRHEKWSSQTYTLSGTGARNAICALQECLNTDLAFNLSFVNRQAYNEAVRDSSTVDTLQYRDNMFKFTLQHGQVNIHDHSFNKNRFIRDQYK